MKVSTKELIIVIFLVLLSLSELLSQDGFKTIIDKDENSLLYGTQIIQTSDGGYLVLGNKDFPALKKDDVILVKLGTEGEIIWQREIEGQERYISPSGIVELPDRSYLVVGCFHSYREITPEHLIYVFNYSQDGKEQWVRPLEPSFDKSGVKVRVSNIVQTYNGNIVFGSVIRSKTLKETVCLIKINTKGEIIWEKEYPYSFPRDIKFVNTISDGGFIVTGRIYGDEDKAYLLKFNSSGEQEWFKKFDQPDIYSKRIFEDSEGNFLLLADTDLSDFPNAKLVKVDSKGTEIWSKKLINRRRFHISHGDFATQYKSDKYFIVCNGYKEAGPDDLWDEYGTFFVLMDKQGNQIYEEFIGGMDQAWDARICDDGSCLILANPEDFRFLVLKVNLTDFFRKASMERRRQPLKDKRKMQHRERQKERMERRRKY